MKLNGSIYSVLEALDEASSFKLNEEYDEALLRDMMQKVLGIYKEDRDASLSGEELVNKFKPILTQIKKGGKRKYTTAKLLNLYTFLRGSNASVRNLTPDIVPSFIFIVLTNGIILTGDNPNKLIMYKVSKIKTATKSFIFQKSSADIKNVEQLVSILDSVKPNSEWSQVIEINKAGNYNCRGVALIAAGSGINKDTVLRGLKNSLNLSVKDGEAPTYGIQGFDIDPITVNPSYTIKEKRVADIVLKNINKLNDKEKDSDKSSNNSEDTDEVKNDDGDDEIVELIKLARKYRKVHSKSRKQKIVDQAQELIDDLNDDGENELSLDDVKAIAYGESEEDELADDTYTLKKDNESDTKTWKVIERVFYGVTKEDAEKVEEIKDSNPQEAADVVLSGTKIDADKEDRENIGDLAIAVANNKATDAYNAFEELPAELQQNVLTILSHSGLLSKLANNNNMQTAIGITNDQLNALEDLSRSVKLLENLVYKNDEDKLTVSNRDELNEVLKDIVVTLVALLKSLKKKSFTNLANLLIDRIKSENEYALYIISELAVWVVKTYKETKSSKEIAQIISDQIDKVKVSSLIKSGKKALNGNTNQTKLIGYNEN